MTKSFLFLRCQLQASAGTLTIAVPEGSQLRAGITGPAGLAWRDAQPAPASVSIECAPGKPKHLDGGQYAGEKAYAAASTFEFQGAVRYARVPTADGWALWVQAEVRLAAGLPADFEALLVLPPIAADYPPGEGGPVNGPHLPWP